MGKLSIREESYITLVLTVVMENGNFVFFVIKEQMER